MWVVKQVDLLDFDKSGLYLDFFPNLEHSSVSLRA